MYTGFARPTVLHHWERRCQSILNHQTGIKLIVFFAQRHSKILTSSVTLGIWGKVFLIPNWWKWMKGTIETDCVQWAHHW